MGSRRSWHTLAKSSGVVVFTLWACDQSGAQRSPQPSPAPVKARVTATASTAPVAPELARELEVEAKGAPAAKARPPQALAENEKDDRPVEHSRFIVDGLNDVGPAAPASAFAAGVVMVTRSDELALSKLQQPPSKAKKPVAGAIEPTARSSQEFWPVARGPAVSATHAYWVSKGRVVRRALGGGELEVLANDARDGTRVAVAGSPDAVAYITRPVDKQDSRAKLRLADGKFVELTPEGAAASSVSLARLGDDLIAGFIDGRSGMTPVHARRFRTKTGALDPDVVVWVAGATQGMTEIGSTSDASGGWLFMPVEKDSSHFGLATLALGNEVKMDPPLRWRTFENGLDRAPATGGLVCSTAVTAYVRPADARPTSNQELVVSALTLAEAASSEVLATARGFADVSLYPLPEGALLAYVADRRTWARLLRCK
jgi:hypothetical protein